MRTLLALLFASITSAAPTHIVDVLYQPNGNPPAVSAGTDVTISQGLAFVSGNNYYPAFELTPHPVTDSAGNVDIWLEPNPTGQPYTLLFRATNGVITRDCWVVPVSASPLKIKDVRSTVCTVTPSAVVQLGQLAQGGAIQGDVITWNNTLKRWEADTPTGGGTPGGTSGQVQYNNSGAFGGFTVSGDCTVVTSTGVLTCGNTLARTGTDINTSNQVTATHLASALPVNQGGTGDVTLAAHGTLIGEGTSPVAVTSPGTAGQVLTSNGPSADPTYQAAAGGAVTEEIWLPGGNQQDGTGLQSVYWNSHSSLAGSSFYNSTGVMTIPNNSVATVLVPLHETWTGSIVARVVSTLYPNNDGGNGTYVLAFSTACGTPGTTDFTAMTYNAAQTVTVTLNNNYKLFNKTTLSPLTTTGCSAGQYMSIKLERNQTTYPTDTAVDYVALAGVKLSIQHN